METTRKQARLTHVYVVRAGDVSITLNRQYMGVYGV